MTHFHTIDDLFDMLIRSGRGMAIIVEGETYADDAFFYGRWFGGQAGQISFYPQDGWPQVVTAIRALRQRISASRVQMPVYGIIDRDETPEEQRMALLDSEGVARTRRYTLENHLLDPECWARVFQHIFMRNPTLASGWIDVFDIIKEGQWKIKTTRKKRASQR